MSRERTLTNTSDYTDISMVYLIRAIALRGRKYIRARTLRSLGEITISR